jgi:starch phosphorylase
VCQSRDHPRRQPLSDTGELAAAFAAAYARELGQSSQGATREACLRAAALACRDLLEARWARTQERDRRLLAQGGQRRVHYLSMEFLMGRALGNALAALGLDAEVRRVLAAAGHDLGEVLEREPDAALGKRRPGPSCRLLPRFLRRTRLPSFGYGLRYRYGMFAQRIHDGHQVEVPDDWMRDGTPWDVERPDLRYAVGFGGRVVSEGGRRRWLPAQRVLAVAHDFVVPARHGDRSRRCASGRRRRSSRSTSPPSPAANSTPPRARAVPRESLNWVLYPDDSTAFGRELRLKQEALLVSASLQDLLAATCASTATWRSWAGATRSI